MASTCKDGAAPHSVQDSGDTQPNPSRRRKKLLDQFRDKMRSLHYALTTEKCYRHWIVEILHLHRAGGKWRHPAKMGKLEIEAFLSQLASVRKVSAKTQNHRYSRRSSGNGSLLGELRIKSGDIVLSTGRLPSPQRKMTAMRICYSSFLRTRGTHYGRYQGLQLEHRAFR